MDNAYTRLLTPFPGTVADPNRPYQCLTERHLQAAWYDQKYLKNLTTCDASPIEVLSPGIWNSEAGPDFLKAHLRISGVEVRGSVEIHLRDQGWEQHQHHLNPKFDDVILHVSLWKPKEQQALVTHGGKEIPRLYLEDHLTVPSANLPSLIDVDLYPYRVHSGSGKCGQKLFSRLDEEEIGHFLQSAADWRLYQKKRALSLRLDEPELLLPSGVAMALGYKRNSEAFLQLFLRLYKMRALPEDVLLSLALGACGFFDAKWQERWGASAKYSQLLQTFDAHRAEVPGRYLLELGQVRPLNHPVRRLAYLIKWIRDPRLLQYHTICSQKWQELWKRAYTTGRWRVVEEALSAVIPAYDDPHWFSHYTFEEKQAKKLLPLIGASLRREIVINTLFPLLNQDINSGGNSAEMEAFTSFFKTMRAAPKGKTQYLIHRFFGFEGPAKLLSSAMHEQGAYQLHRDFCTHFEASCDGCPFVERYKDASLA